jgi:AcrR family transcriptional regulator
MTAARPPKALDHRVRVGRQRRARTETRILAAALGVFAEHGPEGPVIDDFVRAAGISRGTFYNHFSSVKAVLEATSAWTTSELLYAIEEALEPLEGPVLRFGVGLRLFLEHARTDRVWSRFVARVWQLGGIELPSRDLTAGRETGLFVVPSLEAAEDLLFGTARQALLRISEDSASAAYVEALVSLCLKGLGVAPAQVTAAMRHPLPELRLGDRPPGTTTRGT